VLDLAGLRPENLQLAAVAWIFGTPIAATKTADKRGFLLGWYRWLCDGKKSLKTRSSQRGKQPKSTIKTTI